MKKTGAELPTSLSWNTSFQQPRNKRESNIDFFSDRGSDFNVDWESGCNSLFLTLHSQNAQIPKVIPGEKRTAVVSRMVSRENSNYEDVRNIKNAVQKKLGSCRRPNDANDSGFVCSQDSSAKSSVSGISPTSPSYYSPEQTRFSEKDQCCNGMLQRSEITYSISEGLYDKLSFDEEYPLTGCVDNDACETCLSESGVTNDKNAVSRKQISANIGNGHHCNYENTLKTQTQFSSNKIPKIDCNNCEADSVFKSVHAPPNIGRQKTAVRRDRLSTTEVKPATVVIDEGHKKNDVIVCDEGDYYRLDSVGDCCCHCEECKLTENLSDCDCAMAEDYDDDDDDSLCSCCSCSDISVISAGTQTEDQLNPDYDTVYEGEEANQELLNRDKQEQQQQQQKVESTLCCNTCQCSPSREPAQNADKPTIPPPPPIRQNTLSHHSNPQEVIRKHFSTFSPQTYTPEQSPCNRFNRRSFTNEFYALSAQNKSSSPTMESPKYDVSQLFSDDYNATLRPQKQSNPFVIPNKFLDDLNIANNNPFLSTFGPQDVYVPRQTQNLDTEALYQHQYSNEQALRIEQNMLTFTNAAPSTAVSTKKSAINNNPYCSPMVARRLLAHQTQSSQHSLVRTRYGSLDDINETLEQDDSQSDSTDFRIAETINIGKNDTLTKKMKSKWRMVRRAITRGSSIRKNSKN
ncbi:uncharacterized protein LOC142339506 isoform X2 [Convolutriloba macropyga]